MREFLNAILAFIGSESLTNDEFASLPSGLEQSYNLAVYEALRSLLTDRESISEQLSRLKAYFVARGLDLADTPARVPVSEIFIGAALE